MGWNFYNKPPMGWPLDYDSGLVSEAGLWLFNEGSGNIVQDLSGNNNAGTFGVGAASPTWVAGKFGAALSFDDGDYAETANMPFVTSSLTPHSVVAWIYPTVVNTNQCIWSYGQKNDLNYLTGFGIESNGRLRWADNTMWEGTSSGVSISANQWSYVAFSKDSAGVTFCVNGAINFVANTTNRTIGSSNSHVLGGSYLNKAISTELWNGLISHIIVYNRALYASEIAQLYQEPFCMFMDPDELVLLAAATAGGEEATILPQITNAYMRLSA